LPAVSEVTCDGGVLIGFLLVVRVLALGVDTEQSSPGTAFVALLVLVPYFGYEFVATARYGQTIGKRVMRIRVVQVSGAPVSWGASALRVYVPMLMGFGTCGLGSSLFYLSPLFDSSPWKRGRYDQLASTTVVKDPTAPRGAL
jgi:uncharacterized RDD family membrane protein YckC